MIKDLTKLPLHEILLNNGYFYKKDKNSQNWKALENANGDYVIVTKNSKGDYLYINPKDDNDKGNIINFSKNRGISYKDLINGEINYENIKDDIKITATSDKTAINKYKALQAPQSINYFTQERNIDKNLLSNFQGIKSDKYQNIAIPTYAIKNFNNKEFLSLNGFVNYLKTPITKDKDGQTYEKPLKQLCYGSKGLEMLKPNSVNSIKEIKDIIICESSIDSLSLAQIHNFKANNTLICATNGQFTQSHKETLEFLKKEATNANFTLGFDNDEAGKQYKEKALEILPNAKHIKPILKDFNDDLIIANKLQIQPNKLTQKAILDKITNIDKQAQEYIKKHKFYTPFAKEEKIKELRQSYKLFNEIKPKIKDYINLKNIENSFSEIIQIQQKQQLSYNK